MAKEKQPVEIDEKAAKLKALEAALGKIEKDFGKGSIMRMGEQKVEELEVIPTGSITLNHALGVGGYPKGRIIEIYGPESSGKTTLAIHAIAEAQKMGGIAAFIDAEHAFDRFYAEKLGVDVDNLLISQPDNGEQALEIAEQLIRSAAVDIVVVDSVAALTPKAEIEGDMGENKVAPPFRKAEFEVIFGEGISRVSEIFNLAVDMGIIKKSGSWFSYNDSKLGQGAEAVKGIVRDNPELMEEITAKVTERLAEKKD